MIIKGTDTPAFLILGIVFALALFGETEYVSKIAISRVEILPLGLLPALGYTLVIRQSCIIDRGLKDIGTIEKKKTNYISDEAHSTPLAA